MRKCLGRRFFLRPNSRLRYLTLLSNSPFSLLMLNSPELSIDVRQRRVSQLWNAAAGIEVGRFTHEEGAYHKPTE